MSKPKRRAVTRDLTHACFRDSNYYVQRCNGVIVYNATNEALPLTCLQCVRIEMAVQRRVRT